MLLRASANPRRSGVVLLAVLVVVSLLTLAAYQYVELMMAEFRASNSSGLAGQSRALAESGLHYTIGLLSNRELMASTLNSNPWDNPDVFQNIPVGGEEPIGRFSVVAPPETDPDTGGVVSNVRYGVTDEAAKINLNALLKFDRSGQVGSQILQKIMSPELADAILDWMDADETQRSGGAESQYYSALTPGYQSKNGPLDSLEELLLIKGMTPELLFGADRNRNGRIDADEVSGSDAGDLGLQQFLTVYSRESNVDNEGTPRIYINGSDLLALSQALTESGINQDLSNFILAYRLYGGGSSGGGSSGGSSGGGSSGGSTRTSVASGADVNAAYQKVQQDVSRGGSRRLTPVSSLFDLLSSSVSVQIGSGREQRTVTIPSPLADKNKQATLLPSVLDKLTTTQDGTLLGRVNVNTAPQTVLAALPGLNLTDVQTILSTRPTSSTGQPPDEAYLTTAWLVTEAGLQPSAVKAIERYITARSQVYRIQSVGYLENGGTMTRLEAVVDTNNGRPRILYWRDLTELGRTLDVQTGQMMQTSMTP